MGNAIVKLVKKVKKLEGFMKRRNLVLTDSEEEEPEAQGRKSQDDPQDSSVQGLVTPPTTKVNTSGEEQVEEISPNTLEAAKTLSKVASLKSRSIDKGRRYKRRKETKGKKVVSSLDFQEGTDAGAEQVNTPSAEQVNTASGVNTGSIKHSTGDEQLSTGNEKSKEQILQEDKLPAEAIRLDTLQKEEVAKQVHMDSLLAQRIAEEEELNEQQKKRKAQVYMLGSDLQGEDFAKRNVDLVNHKKELKRIGERAQTKTPKRLKEEKDDEAKDDESTKKSGKRRKQMARKGMHTSVDKNDSEDSDEVGEHEESNTGTETPINPVPVAMKTPNDLTELYRIVMNRYGMDGPEDKLEKGFWKCLRIMFEEPLSTDSIWSELGQQKIISWRYYDTCRVHCLNLESMEVYMLSERNVPLYLLRVERTMDPHNRENPGNEDKEQDEGPQQQNLHNYVLVRDREKRTTTIRGRYRDEGNVSLSRPTGSRSEDDYGGLWFAIVEERRSHDPIHLGGD
ncbi:hypothetical protein Tco_1016256 [Tanacetum coccineum]|uniref:Uncharacterized protein n=1 Tax=Tanacetum coccineum TaxID=301880 RepID=A0ABQ5FN51_9ASTR